MSRPILLRDSVPCLKLLDEVVVGLLHVRKPLPQPLHLSLRLLCGASSGDGHSASEAHVSSHGYGVIVSMCCFVATETGTSPAASLPCSRGPRWRPRAAARASSRALRARGSALPSSAAPASRTARVSTVVRHARHLQRIHCGTCPATAGQLAAHRGHVRDDGERPVQRRGPARLLQDLLVELALEQLVVLCAREGGRTAGPSRAMSAA